MESIEVKLYMSPSELREAASLVLKHRLYVAGWTLFTSMNRILHLSKLEHSGYRLSLVLKNGVPVAVGFFDSPFYQVMAFCRKTERRRGYGSMAIQNLRVDLTAIFADEGVSGTDQFWLSNKVDLRCHWCP